MRLRNGKINTATALLAVGLLAMLCVVGCTEKKSVAVEEEVEADSLTTDSLPADTITDIIEDAPLPKAVDELFDDFFFNFAGNRHMQMSRIEFPLPIHEDGATKMLDRKQWHYSHFFMSEGYYTLLLDDEEQDSLSKKSTLDHAEVEKLYMNENLVKQYVFDRIDGEWRLTSVAHTRLSDHPCGNFLHFYQHFATDTAFQTQSLDEFVLMTVPDSDEEFSDVTGAITREQWPFFKPALIPENIIYNVNYGQALRDENQKVMVVRGVANGLNTSMTFKRKNEHWKLVKFSE